VKTSRGVADWTKKSNEEFIYNRNGYLPLVTRRLLKPEDLKKEYETNPVVRLRNKQQ